MDEEDSKIIQYLEENNALIWEGMDEDGEAIFRFNLEVLKEVMPELHKQIIEDIDEDLLTLYQEGLVELEYDEELNAKFKLSEKGQEVMKNFPKPPFLD
jgi:hypothetical protein